MDIDIRYVANLARIHLTEEEISRFAQQFKTILAYINKLKEVDITNVPPTSHVLLIKNIFRDDKVRPSLPSKAILKNAPAKKGAFFTVPRVIDET